MGQSALDGGSRIFAAGYVRLPIRVGHSALDGGGSRLLGRGLLAPLASGDSRSQPSAIAAAAAPICITSSAPALLSCSSPSVPRSRRRAAACAPARRCVRGRRFSLSGDVAAGTKDSAAVVSLPSLRTVARTPPSSLPPLLTIKLEVLCVSLWLVRLALHLRPTRRCRPPAVTLGHLLGCCSVPRRAAPCPLAGGPRGRARQTGPAGLTAPPSYLFARRASTLLTNV